MPYYLVRRRVEIPRRELRWRFSRSMGPSGEWVNTNDSRVEISWDAVGSQALPPSLKDRVLLRLRDQLVDGFLTVVSTEHRSQEKNRRVAEAKLARLLADAMAPDPPPRSPTRPSRRAAQLDAERQLSQTKRLRRDAAD